ncbi:hypothetical protein RO3G_14500 [Rhizopus delemar RA 99-880]|uniref:Uncharacterized protein n=1 Tax=Rhizopus delemar (strain RA 99-880 / ATCC MYA-4621 / FGSC 9543 / NRRL 43880) TaxID=246409 RepID=I1CMV9_RHIO9|nr:hypothetical protein RO3G_14500 [Rhizopus delemar RA 99-880]|eukprot:EIE89789.1 hypothetical protein RO3G_14500 [Rhizopus delemar RA 99-880]
MNEGSLPSTSVGSMSTTGALASDYCILSVESSVDGIG